LQARWDIEFPDDCDAADVCALLEKGLLYDWHWDNFIWELHLLHKLLTERPPVFDYYYVTRFLVARASHLMMIGPFASGFADVWAEVARQKLQYAGLYRHLFTKALEEVLAPGPVPARARRFESRMFVTRIQEVEQVFLRLVEAICLMPGSAADFAGYPVGCWVQGGLSSDSGCALLLPAAVAVVVGVEEAQAFRTIRPGKREMATLVLENRVVRRLREFGREITATDRDLQRMCRVETDACAGKMHYEGEHIGYYRTMAGEDRGTLLVVCADRTMILIQAGHWRPGTHPRRIFPGIADADESEHVYLVEFDNGVSDFFQIEIRAHSEEEARLAKGSATVHRGKVAKSAGTEPRGKDGVYRSEERRQGLIREGVQGIRGRETGKTGDVETAARIDPIAGGKSLACRRFGVLTIYGDFEKVVYEREPYDLGTADQGRAMLRYLCEVAGAIGKAKAVTTQQIKDYVKEQTGLLADDWRPAHVLRGKLAGLYAAIGSIKAKGTYWIEK
jgi:hypothetical protein